MHIASENDSTSLTPEAEPEGFNPFGQLLGIRPVVVQPPKPELRLDGRIRTQPSIGRQYFMGKDWERPTVGRGNEK